MDAVLVWHKLASCCRELYRGKLGNGEHLSFEAYKYKHNNIFVTIIR